MKDWLIANKDNVSTFTSMGTLVVSVFAGIVGEVGLAVAGLSIYALYNEIDLYRFTKED